jgi:hypothetical protein
MVLEHTLTGSIERSIESAIKTVHSVVEAPIAQILKEHGRFEEISKVVDAECATMMSHFLWVLMIVTSETW